MANAIRSDGERNPIRRRTQSNQAANGIRSDGERNLRGCSSLCCTNKANGILPQNARNAQKSCRRVWHPAIPTHPHS